MDKIVCQLWDKGRSIKVTTEMIGDDEGSGDKGADAEDTIEEFHCARILVKIYSADTMPKLDSGIMAEVRKRFYVDAVDILDPYVQVTFDILKGSTSKKKRTVTPCWNEQITFNVEFPCPDEPLILHLRDDDIVINHIIGTAVIHLDKISNSGEGGFLPIFGPSFVYLHESKTVEEDVSYRGRILIEIDTEVTTSTTSTKPYVKVEPIPSLPEGSCGYEAEFLLFSCIREASMIDKKVGETKDIRFTLQMGEAGREQVEHGEEMEFCTPPMLPLPTSKQYLYLPIYENKPCLWLKNLWPDTRRRMYISNILLRISKKIEECITEIEKSTNLRYIQAEPVVERYLRDLEATCTHYLKILRQNSDVFLCKTELDKERLKIHRTHIETVREVSTIGQMDLNKIMLGGTINKLRLLMRKIQSMVDDPQPSLPDAILWMECGHRRVGYSKIPAKDLIFAVGDAERGVHCGTFRSLFFKSLWKKKKDAILGKVDSYLWLGLTKHINHCFKGLPSGYDASFCSSDLDHIDYIPKFLNYYENHVFELRAHIYQARSLPSLENCRFPSPVARVFIRDRCISTQVRENTLNPIWDEMLLFRGLMFHGDRKGFLECPPHVVIEIFNTATAGKSVFLGRCVTSAIAEESESRCVPCLQWYDVETIVSDEESQLLAAFEFISVQEEKGDMEAIEDLAAGDRDVVLPIPPAVRPVFSMHRIEVLFWGLRELKRVNLRYLERPRVDIECAGQVLQSSPIVDYVKHSNFVIMTQSLDMELPEQELYFPALTIKLQDCKSFGRQNAVASHVVRALQKYVFKTQGDVLICKFEDYEEGKDVKITIEEDIKGRGGTGHRPKLFKGGDFIIQKVAIPWKWRKMFISVEGEDGEEKDWWTRYYISSGESPLGKPGRKSEFQPRTSMLGWECVIEDHPFEVVDVPRKSLPEASIGIHTASGDQRFAKGLKKPAVLDADAFIVYPCELENVKEFGGFQEWLHSFELTRRRKFHIQSTEKAIAIFKGCFRVYKPPLPSYIIDPFLPIADHQEGLFQGLPENSPMKVLVRAYIVKAIELPPSDATNTTDAYIVIQLGNQKFNDKENYISKQLNPVFGKCFEFVANFPSDSLLHIQLFDWDLMGADDLIGETKIDLENRFYSRHRPTCGLARTYETTGPNAWRDALTPVEILTQMCQQDALNGPFITEKQIRIGNVSYDFRSTAGDDKATEENMALYLLHRWDDISPARYQLTPEHVETRTLYHPSKPGEAQGKLMMWIDMFPENTVPPISPRDISTRKPSGFELRVIIWNTDEVVLADDAFFTGEKMSDIYVKGWLTGKEQAQSTDVHYRSLTGEGNFNWRFVFPFDYLAIERQVVVMKKVSVFSWDETEFKIPPVLELEVWDADHFSADECLGTLSLDLNQFPRGAKTARQCSLDMLKTDGSVPQISLFKQTRVKGWWPFFVELENGEKELTGKVEAELHLVTAEEAEKSPAGVARKEPDALSEPRRPETSFVSFMNPLKTLRYAFWKNYKWTVIKFLFIVALTLIFVLFFYSVPGYSVKKIIGA